MRVFVVIAEDGTPLLCNPDRGVAERAMNEMVDAMRMSAAILPEAQRVKVIDALVALRIVTGTLEIDVG